MNNNETNIHEDAKSDWMKLVKKHKKKQKGLPALSKLNTDAGNVEHNISMFNKMNSPTDGISTNAVSGPFGENLSVVDNNLITEGSSMNSDKVELNYYNLDVPEVSTDRVIKGDRYEPDEVETIDLTMDYTYVVDKQDVIEFLQDLGSVQEKYWSDDLTPDDYWNILENNFDNLFKEYEDMILDNFEEDAISHIQETYVYDTEQDRPEYDPYDDIFDMSMRTLL